MKAGLEVHQQLATGKLFCACPADLSEEVTATAVRRLRATSGENHLVDRAADFQASRGLQYRYQATASSCLVELDEEPPHALNPEALEVALTVALLLNARPLDEVVVMRKIVVDGSNTSGFQRTALVAVDGTLEIGERRYTIPTICLEEDAARKMGEEEGIVTYRLDRLGIPLVEIATGPEIRTGSEAREVAEELGALLRSTERVRRGIGTIREDLNVSIEGGARVEIKGVQELRLIQRYAAFEAERQTALLRTRDRLREQGAVAPGSETVDATALLRPSATGGLGRALKEGGVARALRLPGFAGTLRPDLESPERLGRELADIARTVGLRGLVHTDELPGYGLGPAEVEALRALTGALDPKDAVVVIAAPDGPAAERAFARVRERSIAALEGVPPETRDPLPDGRSRYSRPLPGRDRMYPETDVPPVSIDPKRLERLRNALPEGPAAARRRLSDRYGLPIERVHELQRSGEISRFEALVSEGLPANRVARLLSQELPEAQEDGPDLPEVPLATLGELLRSVESGLFAKEGIVTVLREIRAGAGSVSEAARRAGLAGAPAQDLDSLAREIVDRNRAMVVDRGEGAFAPLMGDLMRELRGKRDGKEVAAALRRALVGSQGPSP